MQLGRGAKTANAFFTSQLGTGSWSQCFGRALRSSSDIPWAVTEVKSDSRGTTRGEIASSGVDGAGLTIGGARENVGNDWITSDANDGDKNAEAGDRWVPAEAGKAKAGMVHSVSGYARGAQVKLLRTRAIPERLRGVIKTRRYRNPRLPYLTLQIRNATYLTLTWH